MADPLDLPGNSLTAPEPTHSDQIQPGYRYAKALCEAARSAAAERARGFTANWDYMLGKGHWKSAKTMAARQIDQWAFKGVCNWTFATIKTKAAMLTTAPSEIFCEPLDQKSTYLDRLLVKSAIEHELTRLRFNQVKEDAYLWGSVSGVGISMISAKPDPLTGAMVLALQPIRSDEFFKDPSADSITSPNCRYVVWETELDMSTVRSMWPSKVDQVKPNSRQVTGGWTYKPGGSDDNLIYGTAGEFVVDSQNTLKSRKARVSFVWIRDESITADLQEVILKNAGPGYQCVSCDALYEIGTIDPSLQCPTCSGNLEDVEIPAKVRHDRIERRTYPYGRLIVYSGTTLLYDGENPYEIETVFPFAVYHHERIPGDFYGANDVTLLASLQEAENTVISMGVDGVVLSMFGPFEYPVSCKSYTELGNGPKERHPVPDHLAGKARFVGSSGADMQLWNGVLANIEHQFQILSGIAPMGFGQASTPPISATEAEISNARLSDRMKGHASAYSQYQSDVAGLVDEMARQFYDQPMSVSMQMPDSEIKSTEIEWGQLPKVNIRVEVNTHEALKDKLLGQNAIPVFSDPVLQNSPYFPDILGALGFPPTRIKEMMARRGLQQELLPPGTSGPSPAALPSEPAQPLPEGGPNGF